MHVARLRVALALVLCATTSCLLDRKGTSPWDGGGDADLDGDGDGDTDSDFDEDGDGDPDPDEDADTDGAVPPTVERVEPADGYTCGWANDPRPDDDKDVQVELGNATLDRSFEVRFGDIVLASECRATGDGCIRFVRQVEVDGAPHLALTVRYPSAARVGTVAVTAVVDGEPTETGAPFTYELLPVDLSFESEALALGGDQVSALGVGELDAERGEDVAVTLLSGHTGGVVRLVSGAGPDAARLSDWSGQSYVGVVAMAVGDLPGNEFGTADGELDLATVDGLFTLSTHENDGSGTFSTPDSPFFATGPLGLGLLGVAAGDLVAAADGDELVIVPTLSAQLIVCVRTFSPPRCRLADGSDLPLLTGAPPVQPVIADFDGDGSADVAVPVLDVAGPVVQIETGAGDGSFSETTAVGLQGGCVEPGSAVAADFDADGAVDLLAGCVGTASLGLLRGRGDGSFEDLRTFPSGLGEVAADLLAVGDANRDSIPDVVASASLTGSYSLLLGTGEIPDDSPPWTRQTELPSLPLRALVTAVALADLDDDGYDELLLGGKQSLGEAAIWIAWVGGAPRSR